MKAFKIGKTEVPVSVKANSRMKARRLSVSAGGVLIEAPIELLGDIHTFLESKASWIFTEWQKHKDAIKQSLWPETFATGAKVVYFGRYTPIFVSDGDGELEIRELDHGFEVKCPASLNVHQRRAAIRSEFVDLFSERLLAMAQEVSKTHGFTDLNITVSHRKDRWAVCREGNRIILGWDLIFLPKPVVEYVIVHELVHTRERHHKKEFWGVLGSYLPDYREREAALRECETKFSFEESE